MRLCGETITVFNARVDARNGETVFRPTVLRGVSWRGARRKDLDPKGGLTAGRGVALRIPAEVDAGGRRYVEPSVYASGEDDGTFTLNGGDIVVRAEVEGTDWTPSALRAAYDDCATVLGVSDDRRAPRGRHWRVVAE